MENHIPGKTALIKQIRELLKERGILKIEKEFTLIYSNNQTSNIYKLDLQNLQKLLSTLQERTVDYIINGMYGLCFSLGIIKNIERSTENDNIISTYLIKEKIGSATALKDKNYAQLYASAIVLSDVYLKHSAQLNN